MADWFRHCHPYVITHTDPRRVREFNYHWIQKQSTAFHHCLTSKSSQWLLMSFDVNSHVGFLDKLSNFISGSYGLSYYFIWLHLPRGPFCGSYNRSFTCCCHGQYGATQRCPQPLTHAFKSPARRHKAKASEEDPMSSWALIEGQAKCFWGDEVP